MTKRVESTWRRTMGIGNHFHFRFSWRPRIFLGPLLFAALGSYACESPPQERLGTMDRSAACANGDWIGILEDPRFPVGEPLTRESKLVARPPEGQEQEVLHCPEQWEWVFSSDPRQPPPPGLQRFCRYIGEREDPRPAQRIVEEASPFVEFQDFKDIVRDCLYVGPAAETLFPSSLLAGPLHRRFRTQALGQPPSGLLPPSGQVRLVIVDSVQDDERPHLRECPASSKKEDLQCSAHGEVLVKLARDLLCNGDDCPEQIATRRVLRETFEVRADGDRPRRVRLEIQDRAGQVQGGSAGTILDLARAIRREMQAWSAGAERPRVVLNLSVGLEPMHVASSSETAALRAALQDASCRGALVVVSAGNRVSGPPADVETPLLPAAWEEVPAPTLEECRLLVEGSAQDQIVASAASYRPLLYAAGGVQAEGKALSNSRPKATPRLVAYGDHAVSVGQERAFPLKILTGTSVSALVVSAAAARLWSAQPALDSFEVMERLHDQSDDSAVTVDFCLDPARYCPPDRKAKHVSVYPRPSAPASSLTSPAPLWPEGAPGFEASVTTSIITSVDFLRQVPACGGSLKLAASLPADAVTCPQELFDIRSQPWMGPQPGSNHNPACRNGDGSPGVLMLEFDPCFRVEGKAVRLDDLTLLAGGRAYRLPVNGFVLGDRVELPCPQRDDPRRVQVVLTDFEVNGHLHPMYLAATINGNHATLTPILQVLKEN